MFVSVHRCRSERRVDTGGRSWTVPDAACWGCGCGYALDFVAQARTLILIAFPVSRNSFMMELNGYSTSMCASESTVTVGLEHQSIRACTTCGPDPSSTVSDWFGRSRATVSLSTRTCILRNRPAESDARVIVSVVMREGFHLELRRARGC